MLFALSSSETVPSGSSTTATHTSPGNSGAATSTVADSVPPTTSPSPTGNVPVVASVFVPNAAPCDRSTCTAYGTALPHAAKPEFVTANRTVNAFLATTDAGASTDATARSGRFWSLTWSHVDAPANAPDGSSAYTLTSFAPSSAPSSSVRTGTRTTVSPAGITAVAGIEISPAVSKLSATARSDSRAELCPNTSQPASSRPSFMVAGSAFRVSAGTSLSTTVSTARMASPFDGCPPQPHDAIAICPAISTSRSPSTVPLSTGVMPNRTDSV